MVERQDLGEVGIETARAAAIAYQLLHTHLAIQLVADRTAAKLGALLRSRPRYSQLGLHLTHPYYGLQRSGQTLSKRFESLVASLGETQDRESSLREAMKGLLGQHGAMGDLSQGALAVLMEIRPKAANASRVASLLTQLLTESSWVAVRANEEWLEGALTKIYGKTNAPLHRELRPFLDIETECRSLVKQVGRLARLLLPMRIQGVEIRAEVEIHGVRAKERGRADFIAAQILRRL
jgi:hypothetical protein